MNVRFERRPAVVLALCLLLAGAAYVPGLGGAFLFDDFANLSGLRAIQSDPTSYSVAQYVLNGPTGDLGRPLSLLSFAAQATSWEQRPQDFIAFNVALHALNGALWYALLTALQRAGALPRSRALPVVAAALWLLLPIHIATVLYVVQRMTILATACFLAGSLLYVQGRLRALTDPKGGYVRMAAGVFVGTFIGTLCKETAALTPLMLLVLEATLLAQVPRPKAWSRASALLLWLPSLALLAYLGLELPRFSAGYTYRTFTLGERLLTETRVLFLYLADAFLPSGASVRMLYDDLPLSTGWLAPRTTGGAMAAWAALAVCAIRLRGRIPVVALALGWYLAANILESGVIPLEIAFTHRSYLPLLGPSLGVTALAFEIAALPATKRIRGLLVASGGAYLLLLLGILWRAASLWGHPVEQARTWLRLQPASERAVLTYGNVLLHGGDLDATYRLYTAAQHHWPADAVLALSTFELACYSPQIKADVDGVRDRVQRFDGGEVTLATGIVQGIAARVEQGQCPYLAPADTLAVIDTMLASPRFASKQLSLYHASAALLDAIGQKAAALTQLEKAVALDPQIPLLQQAVLWSLQLGDTERARAHVQTAEASPRISARRRWLFRREISGTRQLLSLYESTPDR